jgi:succinate dehydrogenase/fumarate reductase-like Fe-S protein
MARLTPYHTLDYFTLNATPRVVEIAGLHNVELSKDLVEDRSNLFTLPQEL